MDVHYEGMTQHCQTSSAVDTARPRKKRATNEPLEKRYEVKIGHSRTQLQLEKEVGGG